MRARSCVGLAIVLSCAACGGEDRATRDEYRDVAEQLATLSSEANGGDLVLLREVVDAAALGVIPPGLTVDLEGRIRGRRGDANIEIDFECRDAASEAFLCGPNTKDASFDLSVISEVRLSKYTAHVERSVQWMVSELQFTEAKVDGRGNLHTISERRGSDDRFHIAEVEAAAEYRDLVVRGGDR